MRIAELGTPFAEKPSSHWVFRFDTYRAPRYNRKNNRQGKGQRLSIRTFYVFQQSCGVFGSSNKLIYTFEERCDIIAELGMDVAAFARFDENFRDISPLEFMRLLLSLNPVCLVCGFDYSFGKGAEGKPETLRDFFCRKA